MGTAVAVEGGCCLGDLGVRIGGLGVGGLRGRMKWVIWKGGLLDVRYL